MKVKYLLELPGTPLELERLVEAAEIAGRLDSDEFMEISSFREKA